MSGANGLLIIRRFSLDNSTSSQSPHYLLSTQPIKLPQANPAILRIDVSNLKIKKIIQCFSFENNTLKLRVSLLKRVKRDTLAEKDCFTSKGISWKIPLKILQWRELFANSRRLIR